MDVPKCTGVLRIAVVIASMLHIISTEGMTRDRLSQSAPVAQFRRLAEQNGLEYSPVPADRTGGASRCDGQAAVCFEPDQRRSVIRLPSVDTWATWAAPGDGLAGIGSLGIELDLHLAIVEELRRSTIASIHFLPDRLSVSRAVLGDSTGADVAKAFDDDYSPACWVPDQQATRSDSQLSTTMPLVMPLKAARLTSPFGMRINPAKGQLKEHTGVDLAAPTGTPVDAAAAGTVQLVGFDKHGYGRYVVVQHQLGYSTWYAHLSALATHLRMGASVRVGQLIGKVGSTGDATGPHLHFEVRYRQVPIDPLHLIRSRDIAVVLGNSTLELVRQPDNLRSRLVTHTPTNNTPFGSTVTPHAPAAELC
jgi:Peptidase family M23